MSFQVFWQARLREKHIGARLQCPLRKGVRVGIASKDENRDAACP